MKSPAALGGAFLSEEREGSAVRIKNKNSFWSTFARGCSWRLIRETVVLGQDARRSTAVTCTGLQMPPRAMGNAARVERFGDRTQ